MTAMSMLSYVYVLYAVSLGLLVAAMVERWSPFKHVELPVRVAVWGVLMVAIAAVTFRVSLPRSPEWFGALGDFFAPLITLASLAGVVSAVYLQRSELREVKQQTALLRRQADDEARRARGSDLGFVFVMRAWRADEAVFVALKCSGALALRVNVSIMQGAQHIGRIQRAAMAADDTEDCELFMSARPSDHVPLLVSVSWFNVHGLLVQYDAEMLGLGAQSWCAPNDVTSFVARAAEPDVMQFV